jgi:hypothetical protein
LFCSIKIVQRAHQRVGKQNIYSGHDYNYTKTERTKLHHFGRTGEEKNFDLSGRVEINSKRNQKVKSETNIR